MRRLLLALALCLFAGPALAQTCPTRPSGDSSNACASTQFVANAITAIYPLTNPVINGTITITSLTGPLIAHGASPVTAGTLSGTTTVIPTVFGTPTNGNCASWNNGSVGDAGGPCTTGGGGGTVTAATAGQVAYYSATGSTVVGVNTLNISGGYQISSTNVLQANFAIPSNPSFFVGPGGNQTLTGDNNYGFTNGLTNLTGGGDNTCVGYNTCVSAVNLSFATAMGFGACQNAADTATYVLCFGAGAGSTVSGSELVLVGHSAGQNITGTLVEAIGTQACNGIVAGSDIVCIGYNTLATTQTGTIGSVVAIGDFSLQHMTSGSSDVVISALSAATTVNSTVALGSGAQLTAASSSVIIGSGASFFGSDTAVVIIGATAGPGISGSLGVNHSVIIGNDAGQNVTSSGNTNLTIIGDAAGNDVTTATGSICVGANVNCGSATQNSLLNIGNILRGDMANNLLRTPGMFQVGGSAFATATTSELVIAKRVASGTAPGAGYGKLSVVAGTIGGTCKLIMYAGTSTSPVTIIDNVGTGC